MSEDPNAANARPYEAITFAAQEESGSFERQNLLAEFADDPDNDTIWGKAYKLAQQEEAEGQNPYSEFKDISTDTLINLSKKVRVATDFRDRYRLMAEPAPNGRVWFDVLTGFSSPDIKKGIATFLERKLEETSEAKFALGIDLGTGTGSIAETLTDYCAFTVGIDASAELVEVARERSGDKVHYQVGDVTKLPFADSCADVMTAIGLTGALDANQQMSFFNEVAAVLKDGGILIDGYWGDNVQAALIKLSWKNTLADMIVDTVSGKYQIHERLNGHQMDDFLAELGLARTKYSYSWIPEMSLLVYEKDRQKLAAQRRGYSRGGEAD
jgi:ubiquinone/menaquinone biosynthesis C-methylase UbiE